MMQSSTCGQLEGPLIRGGGGAWDEGGDRLNSSEESKGGVQMEGGKPSSSSIEQKTAGGGVGDEVFR
jgi:hypothetical protein